MPEKNAAQEWKNGWKVVFASFVGFYSFSILIAAMSAFMGPMGEEFGWSRTLLSAGTSVSSLVTMTLAPVLGIVELSGYRRFVMADIPGLIEGAHDGAGLGHDFLRHIERTRILIHLLDIVPEDESDPVDNYHKIRSELELHSKVLIEKPEVVVLNKADLDADRIFCDDIVKRLGKSRKEVFVISAVSGWGVEELNERLWAIVKGKDEDNEF